MKHLTSRRARFLELAILLGALFLSEPFSTCAQQKTGAAHQRLALVGGQIYPAPFEKPISDGMILIENGKIAAVGKRGNVQLPPDAETIDCTGHSIVAGLWNSHVHFSEPKWQDAVSLPAQQLTEQLQQMVTGYGFTSVVDTGSLLPNTVALRKRIESGEVAGPRILTAGLPIYPENGVPYYVIDSVPPELVKLLAQPATPEEAERIVDENINQGADIIKVFVVSWVRRDGKKGTLPMKLPILQAAVTEAHGRGKLVFAHPSLIEGVELVLQGHVDVLAHTIEDGDHWNDSIVARLKAANVSLIPTLTLFSGESGFEGILREAKSYSDAGGQILFGTDLGYLTDYADLTKEFALLKQAGLSFPQILDALTTAPAARLGFARKTGRIAAGQDADLAILDGDPSRDISAFSRVHSTLRSGRIIFEAQRR